ncbi:MULTISPECIES: endolytic transglycosylase MltG [Caproicibacterium]|jgi:UPF0755 protein|uniref:Endolytic murein transglycosylase n=1 Tax=Caproicibacterium lactatifermentans TaxID=2666138 RepID=A0A859DWJ7_9FIRM|nr:endolytic transglycosylase MltG [Caproicibacterium lactatifermentans]ARP49928.1 hypothetical protein B6259_02905 [Ruminococcaceae bacterium CPB6]QKN24351.1 endolytic transglycosylase MltG [Caproicibacterium lactatifermentans]QKO30636.1 endolytic transglycosylase MltG [Caproicibacterium lactatifermentans]
MAENEHQQSLSSFSGDAAMRAEAAREAADEKRAIRNHKRRNREKRKKNRHFFLAVWWCMVILVGLVLGQFLITGLNDILAVNRTSSNVTVQIPISTTEDSIKPSALKKLNGQKLQSAKSSNREITRKVANILHQAGLVDDPDVFCMYVRLRKADGCFHNGTWQINAKTDYEELINTLESNEGRKDTIKVTIPEGQNAVEIARLLQKNGVISSSQKFLDVLNTNAFDSTYTMVSDLKNLKGRYYKFEGYLFPDTYEFYQNEDPQNVLQKMLNDSNERYTKEIREKAKAKNMTLDQLITLASIIQAESADSADMLNVSSVLQNRLKYGSQYNIYTLDCDSTMYYPYRSKSDVPSSLGSSYKSKYNTYTMKGLPAGAVCNPGIAAINAALNPNQTSYLYFCHNPKTKKAYYASTQEEHTDNLVEAGLTK